MRIQSHQPPAIIATLTRSLAVPFLILSLLSGSICLAAGSDLLSVTDYGATGNGVTDDAPAIATAIADAASMGKRLLFPAGTYMIYSTIDVGSTTIFGEGHLAEGGTPRTIIKAGTANMIMIKCASRGTISGMAIQGDNKASIGIHLSGARPTLANIEVYRCRKSSFVFASTQNGTFTNCYSSYSATAFTLANGARNNNFYGCTSNNMETWYNASAIGTSWADSKLIYYVIDTNDPDYGSSVTYLGNDRNNWFGGIHERAPVALTFENKSNYTGEEASNNQFYGVELTGYDTVLDTTLASKIGTIQMDSCAWYCGNQDDPMTIGTAGIVAFTGAPFFNGGNYLDNRGITVASNYASLFVIDSDKVFEPASYNGGSISINTTSKSVTVNGGGSSVGVAFSPIKIGNIVNNDSVNHVGKPAGFNAILTYTITEITGSNPVLIIQNMSGSPWRRTLAQVTTPGTYSIPIRFGEHALDRMGVIISANGNTSCTVKGVSFKAVGF